jgi:hypothetical protein
MEERAPMWVTAVEGIESASREDQARSFLRNCVLIPRRGDRLFVKVDEATVLARLDGYVVLPREQYQALLSQS